MGAGAYALLSGILAAALLRDFRRRGLTVLNLFALGVLLVMPGGALLVHLDPSRAYILADPGEVDLLLPEIAALTALVAAALVLQRVEGLRPGAALSRDEVRNLPWRWPAIAVCAFLGFLALNVTWADAPLLNLGSATLEQLGDAREHFYATPLLEATSLLRYLVFFCLAPALFFMRGLGARVPWTLLALLVFFGLLTLAKTFLTFNLVLFVAGRYLATGRLRTLALGLAGLSLALFAVIRATFLSVEDRQFAEVALTVASRITTVPVSLAAKYKQLYAFSEGIRTSPWYQRAFGGYLQDLSGDTMRILFQVDGQAPSGMIGSCFPNLPVWARLPYFAAFVALVAYFSHRAAGIRQPLPRLLLTLLVGFESWFLLMTDPLAVLNTYGLLYLGLGCALWPWRRACG